MEEIKSKLRAFILDKFLQGESPADFDDQTPLKTSGIIDSIGTLELVSFVEDTFDIELEAHETGIEHFGRIEDLAALVATKIEA